MANGAAHLVDRVLPDVPVRQFVLSLPFELRRLAAFKPAVLTALTRIFVEAVFASYRTRAKRDGLDAAECGALTFVQRFGDSLNLNVHFHTIFLDGVLTRDEQGRIVFHPSPPPDTAELQGIVRRVHKRSAIFVGLPLRRRRPGLDRLSSRKENRNRAPTAKDCALCHVHANAAKSLARKTPSSCGP